MTGTVSPGGFDMGETATGEPGIDTILLVLILVVLVIQLFQSFRPKRKDPPIDSLRRHDDAIVAFVESPDHERELERLAVSEAILMAKLDLTMQRLGELPVGQLQDVLASHGYRDINDEILDWLRANLNWRGARAAGSAVAGKLLDKVLSVINKMVGNSG